MHEFDLIKNYFQKLSKKTIGSLNLNDDVFFDKKHELVVSIDTYIQGNHFRDFRLIKKFKYSSLNNDLKNFIHI